MELNGGHNLSHNDLFLNFGIFFYISVMTSAIEFNFLRTLPIGSTINECKTRPQGSKTRSRGYILNLQTTVKNSETAKATGFLFCVSV